MRISTGLCLILLTYKGKVLLVQQEDNISLRNDSPWHCIKKTTAKNKSSEKTILEEVQNELQVTLNTVTHLNTLTNTKMPLLFYHARLNDRDVNNIKRTEGRILQFFSLNELSKIPMQESTKTFFQSNQDYISHLGTN